MEKEILDVCCGSKMMYFNKDNPQVLFHDCRREDTVLCDGRPLVVSPDVVGDYTNLSFSDKSFNLVIFDPPHLKTVGEKSWLKKKYGKLPIDWESSLKKGFNECWRVLADGGTLIFKWSEIQIKLKDVLSCFHILPLAGHRTTQNLKTHWVIFYKNKGSNDGYK